MCAITRLILFQLTESFWQNCMYTRGGIFNVRIYNIRYADDRVLMMRTEKERQTLMDGFKFEY